MGILDGRPQSPPFAPNRRTTLPSMPAGPVSGTPFDGYPAVPHRNHATAAQSPTGGAVGFQTGVDVSPTNSAFEEYLNAVAGQQREPTRQLGSLVRPTGRLGSMVRPAGS